MGDLMRPEILVAMALVLGSPSYAEEPICRPALDAAFSKYGIAADRLSITPSSTSPARRKTSKEDITVGYNFWLPIKDCNKGYLIIDMDLDCNIDQIFTSGPCKFSGVPDC
jgi:hypothetical protein